MIFVALVAVFLTLLLSYNKYKHSYWKRKGVVGPTPTPFVGNVGPFFRMKKNVASIYNEICRHYKNERYVGVYVAHKPAILVRDPEIIKNILSKDFNSFQDNDYYFDKITDPLFSRNPFIETGENWKTYRSAMTPSFTVKKMKIMLPQILNICDRLKKHLATDTDGQSQNEIDVKDLSTKFVTEVCATCVFGLDAEIFTNPKSHFKEMIDKFFKTTFFNNIRFNIVFNLSKWKLIMRLRYIPKEVSDWLISIVNNTVQYRENNAVQNEDFLQSMMHLRGRKDIEFTNINIAGIASSFVFDGIETTSIALAFALYEIAANEDIQNRLRNEVNEVLSKYDNEISYEALVEMEYLDRVLYEALRKYPPFLVMFKRSTQTYMLPGKEENSPGVQIDKGTSILIPVYYIHRNSDYYPDPDKFDPERFTDEAKQIREKYTFLAFGEGPRMCVGMRFALTKNKAALATIIKNFTLSVSPKTVEPVTLDEKALFMQANGGLFVKFRKI